MHRIRMMMFFLASCVGVQMRPSAIEKVELVTALARGPLNIVSLYAEARHQKFARHLKIAAELSRIGNDLVSIKIHKNKFQLFERQFEIDAFHAQQVIRVVQSCINIIDVLMVLEESPIDGSLSTKLLESVLYCLETYGAFMLYRMNFHPADFSKLSCSLDDELIISAMQFSADMLRQARAQNILGVVSQAMSLSMMLYVVHCHIQSIEQIRSEVLKDMESIFGHNVAS